MKLPDIDMGIGGLLSGSGITSFPGLILNVWLFMFEYGLVW